MARIVGSLFAMAFVSLVAIFSCHSFLQMKKSGVIGKRLGFMPLRERVKEVLEERLLWKSRFVNLNGGVLRLAGRRICNGRMRYSNGMIGSMYGSKELDNAQQKASTDDLAAFARAMSECQIPFLFVLAPWKIDLAGELFPPGWDGANMNVQGGRVVENLAREGVRTLNLAPIFTETAADVSKSHFATDHHWRYRTALAAARLVANELAEMTSTPGLREHPHLKESSWKWKNMPHAFLGSDGRRTGHFFSGVDDFEYAVPKFATTITRTIPSKKFRVKGSFATAEIVKSRIDPKAPPSINRYSCYTGPDVDVQRHVNSRAPLSLKVMLIKDSFGNPVAAFWATVFKEVVQVDPRKLREGTSVLDLVDKYRPDAVVEIVNPNFLSAWNLGIAYDDLR